MQGAFREHAEALRKCGCEVIEVRRPEEIEKCSALVIPGGESTTIGKLIFDFNLAEPIKRSAQKGLPVLGTCAGAILLAKEIAGSDQPRLGLMDIRVQRNAYGRQPDSFEAEIAIPVLGEEPFKGVFIRAPYIENAGPGVEVLAIYKERIVAARQNNLVAVTFHPELTDDLRIHRYFLEKVAGLR